MQSFARRMFIYIAFLLPGTMIATPGLARSLYGDTPTIIKKGGNTKGQPGMVPVKPRVLNLKPIPAQRLARLNKEAHAKYDTAMKYIDHINYEKAVEYLRQAIECQPDDVYLRYTLIQLTQYLGDTRIGADSIKYYDITIENLQSVVASTVLNVRERQRAQGALETITGLRQAIGEREEKRHLAGQEIAVKHAQETFRSKDQREREREQKKAAVETYVQEMNATPGSRANSTTRGNLIQGRTSGRGGTSSSNEGTGTGSPNP